MSRDASGNYTLPAGNPISYLTRPISSSTFNATMTDIAAEIQDSLSRSGDGGMLAALDVGNFGIENTGPISGATTIEASGNVTLAGLTASRVMVTDGSKVLTSSAVTATELGYVAGVTSAIQTQLDAKASTASLSSYLTTATAASTYAPIATPTFTGTATGPTLKATTALNLDFSTATRVPYIDASKNLVASSVTPTELGYLSGVTSAIQTQLGTKAPTASPTFTGTDAGATLTRTGTLTTTAGGIYCYGWGANNDSGVIFMNSATTKYLHQTGSSFSFVGANVYGPDFVISSDERLKKDVRVLQNTGDMVDALTGYSFKYKESGVSRIGFMAHEVKRVLPELVHEQADGYLAVAEAPIVALLAEELKSVRKRLAAAGL